MLWVLVVESQRSKGLEVWSIRVKASAELKFPSLLICPTYVDPDNRLLGQEHSAITVTQPTLVNSLHGHLDAEVKDGYAVCPGVKTFVNPKNPNDNHTCALYTAAPAKRLDLKDQAECDLSATGAYYFPVDAPNWQMYGFAPPDPSRAWLANRTSSNVFIAYEAENVNPFPVQALLFSASSAAQPPMDFASFSEQFSIAGTAGSDLVSFSSNSLTMLRLHKLLKNRLNGGHNQFHDLISQDDCDLESFAFARIQSDMASSSRLSLTFDTLAVESNCLRPVFGPLDTITSAGGMLAFLLGLTFVLRWLLYKFAVEGGVDDSSSGDSVGAAGYREML